MTGIIPVARVATMDRLRGIERLDALRAITDPHRMAILRLVLARPRTLSGLGRALDRHPAWVRHHVKVLEDASLVCVSEERTTGNYTEKFYSATAAAFTVSLLVRPETDRPSVMAMVSDDLAMELLAASGDEDVDLVAAVTGSLDGLIGVRQGFADIAGCHLLDTETGQYNLSYAKHLFPDRDIRVVTLAHREQGLMVAPGNPLSLTSLSDAIASGARLVNRNRGSGTRVWLEHALGLEGIEPASVRGYDCVVETHAAAAALVAGGAADFAVGIAAAAERFELDFIPLFSERYDLVMSEEAYASKEVTRLIDRLHAKRFKRDVSRIRGYDPSSMGDEYRLAI